MRFLYGIKQCHRCDKREPCNLKNDPSTLGKVKIFEHTNRGLRRHPQRSGRITTQVVSFCKEFGLEEEEYQKHDLRI